MRRGLHAAVADARRRGREEGAADAVEGARKSLVRRTAVAAQPVPAAGWRVARMAAAIREMDDYGFGGTDGFQGE